MRILDEQTLLAGQTVVLTSLGSSLLSVGLMASYKLFYYRELEALRQQQSTSVPAINVSDYTSPPAQYTSLNMDHKPPTYENVSSGAFAN